MSNKLTISCCLFLFSGYYRQRKISSLCTLRLYRHLLATHDSLSIWDFLAFSCLQRDFINKARVDGFLGKYQLSTQGQGLHVVGIYPVNFDCAQHSCFSDLLTVHTTRRKSWTPRLKHSITCLTSLKPIHDYSNITDVAPLKICKYNEYEEVRILKLDPNPLEILIITVLTIISKAKLILVKPSGSSEECGLPELYPSLHYRANPSFGINSSYYIYPFKYFIAVAKINRYTVWFFFQTKLDGEFFIFLWHAQYAFPEKMPFPSETCEASLHGFITGSDTKLFDLLLIWKYWSVHLWKATNATCSLVCKHCAHVTSSCCWLPEQQDGTKCGLLNNRTECSWKRSSVHFNCSCWLFVSARPNICNIWFSVQYIRTGRTKEYIWS